MRSAVHLSLFWLSALSGVCLLLPASLPAATIAWTGNGADNDISTPENWAGDAVPAAGDTGEIDDNTTSVEAEYSSTGALNTIILSLKKDAKLTGGNLYLTDAQLLLGEDARVEVTGNLHAGRTAGVTQSEISVNERAVLAVSNDLRLGRAQPGLVQQNGADSAVTVGRNLDIGWRNGVGASSYVMNGGSLTVEERLRVRRGSELTLNSGATALAKGNVELRHNNSRLNLNNGTFTTEGNFVARNRSRLNIESDGLLNITGNVTVRNNNTRFNLNGGNVAISGRFLADENGDVFLNSGSFGVVGNTTAGSGGASISVDGATVNTPNLLADNSGVVTVADGTVTLSNDLIVRNGGSYTQTGGVVTTGRYITVQNQTAAGSATLSNGSLSSQNNLRFVGEGNTFTQTGGTVEVGNRLVLSNGGGANINNTYNLNGGILRVQDRFLVAAENTFNWTNGGTLEAYTGGNLIDYNGDLTAGLGAELTLKGAAESLDVSGDFTLLGLTVNGYDLMLEGFKADTVQTGAYDLVTVGGTISDDEVVFMGFSDSIATEIAAGASFDANTQDVYWFELSTDGIRVQWSLAPTAVPEPASVSMLALGSVAFLLRRKRSVN